MRRLLAESSRIQETGAILTTSERKETLTNSGCNGEKCQDSCQKSTFETAVTG
jgi:hypothetical protein